jgi:hypothetical protein
VGESRRRTWANRADAATEQEKAAVAQLQRRPRPQRLIRVAKYPKAEREVIVTFDELKRPAGIDDRHLADLALRDVNRNAELPGRQAIPLPPRSAAGNVRGVVYTDYVNIIADALKAYGACTAKVHEKWSKFLVRLMRRL